MEPLHLRFAEALMVLNEFGEGLVGRLTEIQSIYESDTAPSIIRDQRYAKVSKDIAKSFPNSRLNKDKVFSQFQEDSLQYMMELEPGHMLVEETLDWKEATFPVLSAVAEQLSLNPVASPDVTALFMDLMCNYALVHLMFDSFAYRKEVVVYYAAAFEAVNNRPEPNFERITRYIVEFVEVKKRLREEYDCIGRCVGQTLAELFFVFPRIQDVPSLRNDAVLSIVFSKDELTFPSQDQFLFDMVNMGKYYRWILIGCLFCPNELADETLRNTLLRSALSDGFAFTLSQNVVVPIHDLYEELFGYFKGASINLTKSGNKKMITESATAAISTGFQAHAARRLWVRQELTVMLNLVRDRPALLGPKMQLIWAALATARDEVVWFFRTSGRPAPNKAKGRINEADFADPNIFELIWLVQKVVETITTYREVIARYFATYLSTTDVAALGEAFEDLRDEVIVEGLPASIVGSIMGACKSADPNGGGGMDTIHINWMRLQALLANHDTNVNPQGAGYRTFCRRMMLVLAHARNVYDLDRLIVENASLADLWWYQDAVNQSFEAALTSASRQAYYATSMVLVPDFFPDKCNRFVPNLHLEIGGAAVEMSTSALNKITTQISAAFQKIIRLHNGLDNKMAPIQAIALLQRRRGRGGDEEAASTDGVRLPGHESHAVSAGRVAELTALWGNVGHLLAFFQENESIVVFDNAISPREYLIDRIKRVIKGLVVRTVGTNSSSAASTSRNDAPAGPTVTRPSVMLSKVEHMAYCFRVVEEYVDIDVSAIVREAMLEQSMPPPPVEEGAREAVHVAKTYARFYANFLLRDVVPGVVWSPVRNEFVSVGDSLPWRADQWVSAVELQALAELVGSYGIRVVCDELVGLVGNTLGRIKEIMTRNRTVTEELTKRYFKEAPCEESLARYREVTELVNHLITCGTALTLRRSLQTALYEVSCRRVPFVVEAVEQAFRNYSPNLGGATPDLTALDNAAADVGLDVGLADHALYDVCLQHCQVPSDMQLWQRLPFIIAVGFTADVWEASTYSAGLDAHVNNIHTIATAAVRLISMFTGITDRSLDAVQPALDKFVEVSSIILLRIKADDGRQTRSNLHSAYIIVDLIAKRAAEVSYSTVDKCFPYLLIRASYREAHTPRRLRGGTSTSSIADL